MKVLKPAIKWNQKSDVRKASVQFRMSMITAATIVMEMMNQR